MSAGITAATVSGAMAVINSNASREGLDLLSIIIAGSLLILLIAISIDMYLNR